MRDHWTNLVGMIVFVSMALQCGCSPITPEARLSGHWVGAPNVAADVNQGLSTVAPETPVQPAVRSAAQFLGQLAANTVLSIDLHLRPSGVLLVRGNAAALGFPPDADGTWRITSAKDEVFEIEFRIGDKTTEARLILVSPNEFTLKMSVPDETTTNQKSLAGAEVSEPANEAAKTPEKKLVSITFKREKS